MAKSFVRPAAVAVALGLAAVGAPVVQQDFMAVPEAAAQIASQFNADASGSITIKEAQKDVSYQLFQLKKFASVSDLAAASKTTVTQALTDVADKQPAQAITGTGSDIKFADLAVGLYLVKPSHALHPFLAMLPSTDAEKRDAFVYNLTVDAKPLNDSTKKIVVDAEGNEAVSNFANAGDVINYKIESAIPADQSKGLYADNSWLSSYVVKDALDAQNLENASVKVALSDGTALNADADYAVEGEATVTFTDAGLKKLTDAKKANEAIKLVVTISATVKPIARTDGRVENSATVTWQTKHFKDPQQPSNPPVDNPSNPSTGTPSSEDPEQPGTPINPGSSTPVVTQWAKIRATKVAEKSGGEGLKDAEFGLYTCDSADAKLTEDNRINIAGKPGVWTTGDNGELVIDGINTAYDKLCLVETKAPKGYELNGKATLVTLSGDLTNVTGGSNSDGAGMNVSVEAGEVINLASTDANLPLTGGKGIAIFAALAAIVAAASAWFARRFSARG